MSDAHGASALSSSEHNGPEKTVAQRAVRPEPQEPLPTDRIAFDKQLRLLLAYASASDGGQRAVTNEDVAKLVDMNASTVSLANTFFVKTGLLLRNGRELQPSREVLDYKIAHDWHPDEAPQKLAPAIERSWFVQCLRPKLQMRPVDESEALAELAQRAAVSPDYRPQLRTILSYMVTTGLIRREGDKLVWNKRAHERDAMPRHAEGDREPPRQLAQPPARSAPQGDGAINFSVNISVSMEEIGKWPPDRITAFFAGMAAVLAAKSKGE